MRGIRRFKRHFREIQRDPVGRAGPINLTIWVPGNILAGGHGRFRAVFRFRADIFINAEYFPMQVLSIVVPVLNEELAIPYFLDRLRPILQGIEGVSYEILFVDDGSSDRTVEAVKSARAEDPAICLISLTRNFGKEAALTAGLAAASGDAVIPMDVDLQDPPELIVDFVSHWRDGYDVVYGRRVSRDADENVKRASAGFFYRIFNRISPTKIESNVGDYRLMSRVAVQATLLLRERNRFMKGIFAWVGFRSIGVPYARPERVAGTTKFNYWRLWNFALDGLTSFSTVPLRIWSYIGATVGLGALIYTFVIVVRTFIFGIEVPGYASLMSVMLFLGAVQLISLGVIGEYLGRLYLEAKQRPIYLIRDEIGTAAGDAAPREIESAPSSPMLPGRLDEDAVRA